MQTLSNTTTKTERFLFFSILSLGTALRLINGARVSLWLDELISYWAVAGDGWGAVFSKVIHFHNTPPFFYLILKLSIITFGKNEMALRLPSIIFSLLVMIYTFLIGRKYFSTQTGLFAMALISVSPVFIAYSISARPYSMAMFFYILAMDFFFKWQITNGTKNIYYFILFATLAGYSHYFALTFLIVLFPFILNNLNKVAQKKIISFMFCLPILSLFPFYEQIYRMMKQRAVLGFFVSQYSPFGFIIAFLGLLLGAFLYLSRKYPLIPTFYSAFSKEMCLRLLFLWSFFPIVIQCILALVFSLPSLTLNRYLIFHVLPLIIFTGCLLQILQLRIRIGLTLTVIFLFLFTAMSNLNNKRIFASFDDNWRDPVNFLNKHADSKSLVLFYSGLTELNALETINDPLAFDFLKSPLNGFYSEVSTQTIVIGYPWLKNQAKYHQRLIGDAIHDGDTFWLFAHSNESYVSKFREWLETQLGKGTLEELEKKEYGEHGVIHLRKYKYFKINIESPQTFKPTQ